MTPPSALLLLGPTSSGKTPLGQVLEQRGLAGRRCVHFDFGETMRQAVARDQPDENLSREDLGFLRGVLESGALLEDEHFPIAERLLRSFFQRRGVDDRTLVVLNGLPRHLGQAGALRSILRIETVVVLVCSVAAVLSRISVDTGGDRGGRTDDTAPEVHRKLAIYARRTQPLVEHYRGQGARVLEVTVAAETTAQQVWRQLRLLYRL